MAEPAGSVLARDGARIAGIPLLGPAVTSLYAGTIADPSRPAFSELAPCSRYTTWLSHNASQLTTGHTRLGDVAVRRGSTDPQGPPKAGGARYLPIGLGPQSWEWAEHTTVRWKRQIDPLSLGLLHQLYEAHTQHFAVLDSTPDIVISDCRDGLPVRESDELIRVLSGRLTGHPYLCRHRDESLRQSR